MTSKPAKVLLVIAGLTLLGAACRPRPIAKSNKPVIAVSIFPVASLVSQLTGDWAEVVTLLPASASPHDAELSADQIRDLNRTDLLVVVGFGLDPWAEKAAEAAQKRLSVFRWQDLPLEGRPLLSSITPAPNQHLWLDPVRAAEFSLALSGRLSEQYPEHSAEIKKSTESLVTDLKKLDHEYAEQLAAVHERRLITFHNAFDLIARRYGLEIVARLTDIELTPGGEVTPDKYRAAIEAIRKYQLKVLYAEPEFPDQVVQMLKRQTGVEVLELDAQGNPAVEGYRTYQEMMRSNLKTLVKGQSSEVRVQRSDVGGQGSSDGGRTTTR